MKNFGQMQKVLLGSVSALAMSAVLTPAFAQGTSQAVETVVVTGIRASLTSAQAIKQDSDQMVDSVTAVDIGALPDRNIAEALQRVPGVTLQRGDTPNDLVRMGSTGNAVFIRGLAWVKSLVNGRDEFTAVAGRNLSFGDISADLMQAVNIYKSPTASQIEGGVGGTIDLITRKPFDQDGLKFAVSGDYTYGDLIDRAVPSGNALISDRWNTKMGEIGVLASVDWQEIVNRTDGVNLDAYGCFPLVNVTDNHGATLVAANTFTKPKDTYYNQCNALTAGTQKLTGPDGWAWRQMEFKEQRLAANLVLQWRPNDKLEFTLSAINSYAHNQDMEHYDFNLINATQLQASHFDANHVWTGGPSSLSSIDARGGSGHNRESDVSLNIKYNPTEKLEITADLQFVESTSPYRNMTFYTQQRTGMNDTIDVSGDTPIITYQNLATNSQSSNYIFPFAMDHLQDNTAHSYNGRLDATYRFAGNGLFGLIKSADAGFRTEQKKAISRSTGYNWEFVTQTWLQSSYVTLDGTIHCGTPPCSHIAADGHTYTTATGGLATALSYAELFHYVPVLGNTLPALWVPKAALAEMNTLTSSHIMSAYEPGPGNLASWAPPRHNQDFGQWISFADEHGCTGDDVTCAAAYNTTPGAASSGNRSSIQNEETYAGYLQLDYGYDTLLGYDIPIDGNIGLRMVRTEDTMNAGLLVMPSMNHATCTVGTGSPGILSSSCTDWNTAAAFLGGASNGGATIARPAVKNGYTNYLPSFNFRAKLSDTLQARLAYSETFLRPDFGDTYSSASLSFSFQNSSGPDYGVFNGSPSGYGGNPYLKPMQARNYDGSLEWYFSPSGSLTLSLFHKDLTNYIFTASTVMPITDPISHVTQNFNYTTFVNGSKGKVEGFELAYQQFYDQLPGAWGGLGFQANYTKIYNSGGHNAGGDLTSAVAIAAASDSTLPLEGMSNDSYNLALLYARYGLDARLAWNWRSHYLSSSSDANDKIPVWLENYGQLDGSVFYGFMDHYKVGIQISNITGSEFFTDKGYATFHPRSNTIEADRKFAVILRTNW